MVSKIIHYTILMYLVIFVTPCIITLPLWYLLDIDVFTLYIGSFATFNLTLLGVTGVRWYVLGSE